MKILPNPTLQKWLTEKGLTHLLPGFEVPDEVFAKAMRQAKKSQPHGSAEEQEAWAAYTAVHQAPKPEKGNSYRVFTVADRLTWLWRIAVLLTLWGLLAASVFGQPSNTGPAGPSHGVSLEFQNNAGTKLGSAVGGRVVFKCGAGATTCTYSGRVFTFNFAGGGGGGTTITVNGAALTDPANADLDDTTPAAATDGLNVKFQKDTSSPTNISAYVHMPSITKLGTVTTGTWNASVIGATYGGLGADASGWGAGRYPRANGTGAFAQSSGAAAGVGNGGACSNQFLRNVALNDDAAPTNTCASVTPSDFGTQNANTRLAGPTSGSAATPTFRTDVWADLQFLALPNPRGDVSGALIRHFFWIGPSGTGTTLSFFGRDANTNTGTVSNIAPTATEEPAANWATGTTSGNDAGSNGNLVWRWDNTANQRRNLYYRTRLAVQESTSVRSFWGLSDQSLATMVSADNPAGNYFGLQFSTARGDTNWQCICKDNTTQNVTDSTVAFSAGTYLTLELIGDNSVPNVTVKINGSTVCTLTTNLPTNGTNLRHVSGGETITTAARNFRAQYIHVSTNP